MEWLSVFLSMFGLGQRRAEWVSARRADAFRLTAEVAGEVTKALDLVDSETSRLLARCAQVCPDDPAAAEACKTAMDTIRRDASKLHDLTATVKGRVVALRNGADWERLVRDLTEWRMTASRLLPWIQSVVRQLDAVLDRHSTSA